MVFINLIGSEMGASCCENKCDSLKGLVQKQKKILWIVLSINAVMFFVEYLLGFFAHSQALMADSLDMFGDALAYASTLYVINMNLRAKVRSSQFKAWIMIFLGLSVLAKTVYSMMNGFVPTEKIMLSVALMALAANAFCLWLLSKHKNDDINFKSVWICSRNDIISNSSVIVAAILVGLVQHPWPDIVVGLGIAVLFLKSAIDILKESSEVLSVAKG
jgi:cation diffusion facilitator family transporter